MVDYSYPTGESASIESAQLEKYFKAGLWRMADLETRKLLHGACGASPNDPRASISVNQIPCDVLQLLDQFWVKYSRGRFGFSVQRSIWVPLEQRLYEKTDAWAAFGDRVGWRSGNLFKKSWKVHKDLKFTLDAPAGHLPHMGEKYGILTLEEFVKQLDWCNSAPSE